MREQENTRPGSTGAGGPQAAEGEEWAWMVDEDPAFYLEEAPLAKKGDDA